MLLWSLCYGVGAGQDEASVTHNSSFSSCLSLNATAFFHSPDKQPRDGNLLQMSPIMNSVKPWFTPGWRCWGNAGKDSLIRKAQANGTSVVLVVLVERGGGRGESGGAEGWGGGTGPKAYLKGTPFLFSLWYVGIRQDLHTSKGPSFMCHDGYHWWQLLSVRLHVFELLHAAFVWSSADFLFLIAMLNDNDVRVCLCICVSLTMQLKEIIRAGYCFLLECLWALLSHMVTAN